MEVPSDESKNQRIFRKSMKFSPRESQVKELPVSSSIKENNSELEQENLKLKEKVEEKTKRIAAL